MTAERRTRVSCDESGCDQYVEGPWHEPSRVRELLTTQGWLTAPTYHPAPDYCPAHADAHRG